ncbi:MAG TPA: glycosyltransferase family 4 protein [Chthoniobacterales bacterium]|nr:glycosyltransferase family 4 protein [Chthoniobacterales bacterium]
MKSFDVAIVSVVPSPYQRDIFRALAARNEIALQVYYLEKSAPDSPWPEEPLQPWEKLLPGFWFAIANARFHVVTKHPSLGRHRFIILNSLTSSLSQYVLRFRPRQQKILFWAEPLRDQTSLIRAKIQRNLAAPIRNTDGIIAIGSQAETSYRRQFPSVRRFNIPYHCGLQPFLDQPARHDSNNGEVVFLFCGQIIMRKGVDLLVKAFDQLVRKGHRTQLILTGREAELDEILRPVSDETRTRISYQGFCDPKLLPNVFAKADVFVLPSRYDGWGVVVNQALGAGLPVICSDAVGAGFDLVNPGKNGFRVRAGDIADLAQAMEMFLKHRQLVSQYGAASRKLAKEWTPERGAEKWISALSELDH